MKIIQCSILTLSLCFILQSCSKKNQDPLMGGPDPIQFEVIELWTSEDSTLTLNDFPQIIKVSSTNEQVVKATIEGNNIILSAGDIGSANITITGVDGSTITREIQSITLTNLWRNQVDDTAYKTSALVQADDAVFAVKLKNQILLDAKRTYGLDFKPTGSENGLRTFRHISTGPAEITTGTFDFRELILELNFTAAKEVYKVIPVKNRDVLGLEQDLTEYYKSLNPDKGIQKVIFTHYIKQYILPG